MPNYFHISEFFSGIETREGEEDRQTGTRFLFFASVLFGYFRGM
jgi:hypothetical protein